MIFVEPSTAYERRAATSPDTRPVRRSLGDDWWTKTVFETLRVSGDEPMKFTSLVNAVVRQGHYSRRDERESKKCEMFKLIGRLIRMGRLDRVGRKHITIPRNDFRYRAYVESFTQSLPPPACEMPRVQ